MQEATALGRAHPLVAVAGVEVGADRTQVQRDLAGCVGAVDERLDAGLAGAGELSFSSCSGFSIKYLIIINKNIIIY